MAIYVSGWVCQDVLRESSGIYSAIRLADQISIRLPRDATPENTSIPPAVTHALISYRSEEPEEFTSTVQLMAPSGKRGLPRTETIKTGGGSQGHLSDATLVLDPWQDGLWWFDIFVNTEIKLRIPVRVIHTRLDSGLHPEKPSQTPA